MAVAASGAAPLDAEAQLLLLDELSRARGCSGLACLTLLLPPQDSLSRVTNLLAADAGTAQSTKVSCRNMKPVMKAILSAIVCLKSYSKLPVKGLAMYFGQTTGASQFLALHFEPLGALRAPLYAFDGRFHTEQLAVCVWDAVVWSPQLHWRFPATFRKTLRQLLLVFQRLEHGGLLAIPRGVLPLVFSYLPSEFQTL
mmetsp:Transcript_2093/g.4700  ORF Transcript_2093/g.4700 Transcript_2093/m.4700 type:complete len:198 (-) Transcript_2093:52-645(-)